jgi:hypothetical protein
VFDGGNVLHGVHLIKVVQVLLKLLLNIKNVATEGARSINTLPGLDLELSVFPMSDNLILESFLELELLISRLSDFFNFFTELKERALSLLISNSSSRKLSRMRLSLIGKTLSSKPRPGRVLMLHAHSVVTSKMFKRSSKSTSWHSTR